MTHEGHAYGATSPEELAKISRQAGAQMVQTAEMIRAASLECPVVSVGSTPSARAIMSVPGITEVRPGTYVFQDYNQVRLGVATVEECAATVHATVIATPAPDRVVVDAGTKAVAADRGMVGGITPVQQEGYGFVRGQPGWFFGRASEEHGVLLRQGDGHADDLRVGDRVALHGPVEPARVPDVLAAADALVNNMVETAADKIVFEACASCVPPFASSGVFAPLLPESLRFGRDDPADLARKLSAFAAVDPERRAELGRSLRAEVVRTHSVGSWADGVVRNAFS
jgi:hypothetical protein